MSGLAVAVLLIASLLLAHFSSHAQPMSTSRPLNVDSDLPLPEAGQASTVFSLTALFGAYFGIFVVLGLPALAGIACGTVTSLIAIRHWIRTSNPKTFEELLSRLFDSGTRNGDVLAIAISAVQCAYSASELIILQEISRVLLGLKSDHATLVTVAIGLVAYFYVLTGGYVAVFRTDVLQFVFVMAMVLGFGGYAILTGAAGAAERLWPRPGYWEPPFIESWAGLLVYSYQFLIGAIMGFAFLAAAPDAWKRVFIVTKGSDRSLFRFALFVTAGFLPFLVLVPVALSFPGLPDGLLDTGQIYLDIPVNEYLFILAALGLVASFLSSFDSAIIASAHVGLIFIRKHKSVRSEMDRYNILMVTILLTDFSIFQAFLFIGNPYLLANLLLVPYIVIAGIQAGTGGRPSRLPENFVLWTVVISSVAWIIYFGNAIGLPKIPTTYQLNTVPIGGAMLLFVIFGCRIGLLIRGGK